MLRNKKATSIHFLTAIIHSLSRHEEYRDLYTINENTMPIDIQVLINDGEIGLAMLRIIEIIGEDELKNLGSETLYFLVNALNQMDIDLIRNEILSAILPVRV